MKKKYNEIELEIYDLRNEDIITESVSGTIDGDETQYPIPDGWVTGGA